MIVAMGAVCAVAVVGCSGSTNGAGETADSGAPASDASTASDAIVTATDGGAADDASVDATTTADAGPLEPCPTTGAGQYFGPGTCYAVTPAQTGASPTGENATFPSYAITSDPAVKAKGTLVLYFNGSGGHPQNLPQSKSSFFAAAAATGNDVLAISYPSQESLADQCGTTDACYFATRKSIILGVPQAGAATTVANISLDQGIVDRAVLALRFLASHDPAHGWDQYLVAGSGAPETQIAWSKVLAAGHSQGGGHAAAVGKLFAVNRVIQLSSTCDVASLSGSPVSWTSASNGPWATDPTQFYGFAAPSYFDGGGLKPTSGDTTCGYHAANWANEGMVGDHQRDDAGTCGNTGDTHGESIGCADNYPIWLELTQ